MTQENAAGALRAPPAAEVAANPVASLERDAEPRKFAELAARAQLRGFTLRQACAGYVLQRGVASHHTQDLNAVAAVLAWGGRP